MSSDDVQAERLLREQIMGASSCNSRCGISIHETYTLDPDMSSVIWPHHDVKIAFLSRQDRNDDTWMYWANLVGGKPTTKVMCPGNLWTNSTLLSTEALFRQMGLEMGNHLGEDWRPYEY